MYTLQNVSFSPYKWNSEMKHALKVHTKYDQGILQHPIPNLILFQKQRRCEDKRALSTSDLCVCACVCIIIFSNNSAKNGLKYLTASPIISYAQNLCSTCACKRSPELVMKQWSPTGKLAPSMRIRLPFRYHVPVTKSPRTKQTQTQANCTRLVFNSWRKKKNHNSNKMQQSKPIQ